MRDNLVSSEAKKNRREAPIFFREARLLKSGMWKKNFFLIYPPGDFLLCHVSPKILQLVTRNDATLRGYIFACSRPILMGRPSF